MGGGVAYTLARHNVFDEGNRAPGGSGGLQQSRRLAPKVAVNPKYQQFDLMGGARLQDGSLESIPPGRHLDTCTTKERESVCEGRGVCERQGGTGWVHAPRGPITARISVSNKRINQLP